MVGGMTSTRGLDPFPRNEHPDLPVRQRAALEEVRRAGNAVRWARRNGKPVQSFQYAFTRACQGLEEIVQAEEDARNNPPLF